MRGALLHASPNKNKGSKSEPGQAEIEKALQVEKLSTSLAQAGSNQSISSTASTPTATTGSVTDRAQATTRKGTRKYGSTQDRVKRIWDWFRSSHYGLGLFLVQVGRTESSLVRAWLGP